MWEHEQCKEGEEFSNNSEPLTLCISVRRLGLPDSIPLIRKEDNDAMGTQETGR